MPYTTLICFVNHKRYVARPRDHRYGHTCHGCSLAFLPTHLRHCPRDAGGHLICRLGHGWVWRMIPSRAHKPRETRRGPYEQLNLIGV